MTAVDGDAVWTARRDLLADGHRDRHFVGELEDDGRIALRFGDGATVPGRGPAPGWNCTTGSAAARPATSVRRPSTIWCCAATRTRVTPGRHRRSPGYATRCPQWAVPNPNHWNRYASWRPST
ncbi:hypothetical protein NKH18_40920 [Streptomyces sp. M10(2022)]